MFVAVSLQIKYGTSHHQIIILFMKSCPLHLHILHCTVIPSWGDTVMTILFRYSLIISQAQLGDKLSLPVLTGILEIYLAAFSPSIIGQLQYLWEGPWSRGTQFYSPAISFPPLYCGFFFKWNNAKKITQAFVSVIVQHNAMNGYEPAVSNCWQAQNKTPRTEQGIRAEK